MLPSNAQADNEEMLSPDPALSLDINISLNLEANINLDCGELDDTYDLNDKLPFDEEMEVELKGDEFSIPPPFSDSLSTPLPIAKKATVSGGKQAGKRKPWSRRVRNSRNF